MDKRVIRLYSAEGVQLGEYDISEVDNANAAAPVTMTVETRCDMGFWHGAGPTTELPLFGQRVVTPTPPAQFGQDVPLPTPPAQ